MARWISWPILEWLAGAIENRKSRRSVREIARDEIAELKARPLDRTIQIVEALFALTLLAYLIWGMAKVRGGGGYSDLVCALVIGWGLILVDRFRTGHW